MFEERIEKLRAEKEKERYEAINQELTKRFFERTASETVASLTAILRNFATQPRKTAERA